MIVEVAIGSALVALGVVALRALRRRREELEDEAAKAAEEAGAVEEEVRKPPKPSRKAASPRRSGPRGLQIGDVLLYAESEYWLAGEIYLDEEGFAACVFPTPGAARASFVAQLDEEASDVAFLQETSEVPGGSVPTELPIGGVRLRVKRRGQARVRTAGEHLPRTSPKGEYVLMTGPGDRVLLIVDFDGEDRLSLVGDRISKGMYDLLPGGDV